MMNNVLGQFGLGGRLADNIRERQGMAYYAFSTLDPAAGEAPLLVRAGVDPANVDRAHRRDRSRGRRAGVDGADRDRAGRDARVPGRVDSAAARNQPEHRRVSADVGGVRPRAGFRSAAAGAARHGDARGDSRRRRGSAGSGAGGGRGGRSPTTDDDRDARGLLRRRLHLDPSGPRRFSAPAIATSAPGRRHGGPDRFGDAVVAAAPHAEPRGRHLRSPDLHRLHQADHRRHGRRGRAVDRAARDIYDEWSACHHFSLYEDVPEVLRQLRARGPDHRADLEHPALPGLVPVALRAGRRVRGHGCHRRLTAT